MPAIRKRREGGGGTGSVGVRAGMGREGGAGGGDAGAGMAKRRSTVRRPPQPAAGWRYSPPPPRRGRGVCPTGSAWQWRPRRPRRHRGYHLQVADGNKDGAVGSGRGKGRHGRRVRGGWPAQRRPVDAPWRRRRLGVRGWGHGRHTRRPPSAQHPPPVGAGAVGAGAHSGSGGTGRRCRQESTPPPHTLRRVAGGTGRHAGGAPFPACDLHAVGRPGSQRATGDS